MPIDHQSLMWAIGFSGAALSVTLFVAWTTARSELFLLTWSCGLAVLVLGVGAFNLWGDTGSPFWGYLALSTIGAGFCVVYGASRQFRTGAKPWPQVLASVAAVVAVISVFSALGLEGTATVLTNVMAALILLATARQYWECRSEAPIQIIGISLLYGAVALSFAICAAVVAIETPLVMSGPPRNWAEDLNAIVLIIGLTGIGALSLALNQARVARRHQNDALTDPLTGLINRRALFDRHAAHPVAADTAVIVFDLDGFKVINDVHGHDAGDAVLRAFARVIRGSVRTGDTAARLGGEEFVVVMAQTTPAAAMATAERIRLRMAAERIEAGLEPVACTTSAGLAFALEEGQTFDDLLKSADAALYGAKRDGRNRVRAPGLRLVA